MGRTARKGKRGVAISLVSQYDIELVLKIEEVIKTKLEKMEIKENDALEYMSKITKARKLAQIVKNYSFFVENYLNTIRKCMNKGSMIILKKKRV